MRRLVSPPPPSFSTGQVGLLLQPRWQWLFLLPLGLYSSYKAFLHKDKGLLKRLLKVSRNRRWLLT